MDEVVFPQFEGRADAQLRGLISQLVQLLSMLEVVQELTSEDAAHAVELAGALEAFTANVREDARKSPLDPGARKREVIQWCRSKAIALSRSARHMAKISPYPAPCVHTLLSWALSGLVLTCERLNDAIHVHDLRFESGEPLDTSQVNA